MGDEMVIKWIKNKYYIWCNHQLSRMINELHEDYRLGKMSDLCYRTHLNQYRQEIRDNLGKIRL